jgi:hypothetical protein
MPDGCWLEVDQGREAPGLLAALAAACAPETRAVSPATRGELDAGGQLEQPLAVPDGGLCVRAIAVGSPGISELSLSVADADRVLVEQSLPARFALLGASGPVCLSAGRYRIMAHATRGSGSVWLELRVPVDDAGS